MAVVRGGDQNRFVRIIMPYKQVCLISVILPDLRLFLNTDKRTYTNYGETLVGLLSTIAGLIFRIQWLKTPQHWLKLSVIFSEPFICRKYFSEVYNCLKYRKNINITFKKSSFTVSF